MQRVGKPAWAENYLILEQTRQRSSPLRFLPKKAKPAVVAAIVAIKKWKRKKLVLPDFGLRSAQSGRNRCYSSLRNQFENNKNK